MNDLAKDKAVHYLTNMDAVGYCNVNRTMQ